MQEELKEMLQNDIIKPSSSEWAAPIVLVKKKDGSLRLCVDYRRLNSVSQTDTYPMPRIDDLIDQLGKAKYITTRDLTRGYWQVPVAKADQHKTAFTTPFGLYQFKKMPFGLQGAPATFQRMTDRLIQGLEGFAAAYLDDLIIYSNTWEEHMQHLQQVFARLQDTGLTAKPKKCQFAISQIDSEGEEHPVGYFSRKLLPREERYSTVEKECLAIKLGTNAFRVYLLGCPFSIQTYHCSLEWLHRLKENNARLTRWSLALQPYQFVVHHRAGVKNGNADALSRVLTNHTTTSVSQEKGGGV